MRRRLRHIAQFLLVATTMTSAAESVVVIRAGQLLDVRQRTVVRDAVVVVRGERIAAVGAAARTRIPRGAQVLSFPQMTLLPGLIDTHVHLAWGPAPAAAASLPGAKEAEATLMAGFTSVRNLGSTGMADLALRDAIAAGTVPGPRVQAAGFGLGASGGACDNVFGGEGRADTAEAAAAKVREVVQKGADVVKFCAGGGVMLRDADASAREYTPEIMQAVVAEAHRLKRKVAAHAQGPLAIAGAVEAGVDSVEHGGLIDEATARLMAERHIYWVPTLYRLEYALERATDRKARPEQLEILRRARDTAFSRAHTAIATRVPIALGTDATVIPHGSNAAELEVLVQLGMPPWEAIRAATVNAAQLMGWSDQVGALAPGLAADVIAVAGDPLNEMATLRNVAFVMKNGTIYKRPPSATTGQQGNR